MGLRKDYEQLHKLVEINAHHVSELETQIQCGVSGHKFYLVQNPWQLFDNNSKQWVSLGIFECSVCKLRVTRRMTSAEIQAAKKLGFKPEH